MKNSKPIINFCFLALMSLCTNGCSTLPDKPYHLVCSQDQMCSDADLTSEIKERNDVVIGPTGWGACLVEKNLEIKHSQDLIHDVLCNDNDIRGGLLTPYHEAWLEYTEAGLNHDKNQLRAILNWINSVEGPIQVVVYVHGWHHNADTSDNNPRNNAIKFAFLMAREVDTLKRLELSKKIVMPKVLGIYVGWPGEKYTDSIRQFFSIDSRSKVADQIGRAGVLKEDLLAISNAVNQRAGPNGRMMVMGHSLGGRMLTSVFKSYLDSGNSEPLGKNSLIVTLNAAVGADCYDNVFRYMGHNPQGSRPYWINITSENDSATQWVYNTGMSLGLVESCNGQSEAADSAIGHYRPYLRQVIDQAYLVKNSAGLMSECSGSYFSSQCHAYELDWFSEPKQNSFIVGFPDRNGINVKNGAIEFYSLNFDLENSDVPKTALTRKVWNVRSDESLIDFGNADGGGVSGHHNGYVSTIMMRLLNEVLYSP